MRLIKKLWLWRFELKISKVKDNEKIEFLARELLKELEGQGYSLKSTDGVYGVDLSIYPTINNMFRVQNSLAGWLIPCGTYQPVIKKEVTE
jgi:hypothetical protein